MPIRSPSRTPSARRLTVAALGCALSVGGASPVLAATGGAPLAVTHAGYLLDSGDQPVQGAVDLTVSVFDAASGGTLEWRGSCVGVPVHGGRYAVLLGGAGCTGIDGAGNTVLETSDLPASASRFLEVQVAGTTLLPRLRLVGPVRSMSDIAGLEAALAAKASTSDVQAALATKSDSSHRHDADYVRLNATHADPVWISSLSSSKLQWSTASARAVWAAPPGGGVPLFRALVADDIPALPLTGDVAGTTAGTQVQSIRGVPVTSGVPISGQVLKFNGTGWAPATIGLADIATGGGGGSATTVLRGDGTFGLPRLGDSTETCAAATAGAMRLRDNRFVEVCLLDGSAYAWKSINQANDGSTAALAGTSCKAIRDAGLASGDKVYWVKPVSTSDAVQVYCDMNGGGWTLLAKFANTGEWVYSAARWTDDTTLNTSILLDRTTAGSAKGTLWNLQPMTEFRLDETAAAPSRSVVFSNVATQTMRALMNASGQNLTTTAGSISQFSKRDPQFQGSCGTPSAQIRTNWAGSHGLPWGCCDTVNNRVRLGTVSACDSCGTENGGANSGFIGLGGSTNFRDAHAGSCCGYAQQSETHFDTSGENMTLWGR